MICLLGSHYLSSWHQPFVSTEGTALWRRHLTQPCRGAWQVYYALTNMLIPFLKFYTAMKGFCIAFLPQCSFDFYSLLLQSGKAQI